MTGKLDQILDELRSVIAGVIDLITSPFSSRPRQTKWFRVFVQGLVRYRLEHDTLERERQRYPSTEKAYLAYAKRRGIVPDTVILNHGAKAHWICRKEASKVLVWFHGGGFVLPCSNGHLEWLTEVSDAMSTPSAPFGCVVLNYSLAPEHPYPAQLRQAVEILRYLTVTLRKHPRDIIIGGDSAGGNIAVGVLAHLLHCHPSIPELELDGPLLGAVLLSPWTSFATFYPSYETNEKSDYVARNKLAERWSGAFLCGQKPDPYSEPNTADQSWFSGLDTVVRHILIWGGGGEASIDPITNLANIIKAKHDDVLFVVEPNAAHTDQIFEKNLGYKNVAQTSLTMKEWYLSRSTA